jgi:cation transport regulator ChaC
MMSNAAVNTVLYFAYGSNMHAARMRGRTPSAIVMGTARLPRHAVRCNKRGRDGTGKANICPDPDAHTYGVVYRLDASELALLDEAEGGYARVAKQVICETIGKVSAHTYVAEVLTDNPVPAGWYKQHMIEGAIEHSLPQPYIAWLMALPERP